MASRPKNSGTLYPLTFLLVLLVVAVVSPRIPAFENLKRLMQARTVDSSALGSGDTREILQRLQAVYLVPGEPLATGSENSSRGGSQTFGLDPIPAGQLAEALSIDTKWLEKGVPIAVLLMEDADLDQLHANPFGRGRQWERPAFFAYLENGELLFTTRVGVRIHGGWSRSERSRRSYRVYFRNRYGIDHFPQTFFPTNGSRSARAVVIRNDQNSDSRQRPWPFVSPVAYDIARRVGATAPETKPAILYVNGERLGLHQLVERVDQDYLLAHFDHDEFVLARTESLILLGSDLDQGRPVSIADRVKVGPVEVYREFRNWAKDSSQLDFNSVAARVDIENLSRWLLATLLCSNQDPFQGTLLLDLRQTKEQWFWLLWDFDASFRRSHRGRTTLELILETPMGHRGQDERRWLLKQLIDTSPEYKDYLARLFIDTMNHRTTRAFIRDTIGRYSNLAATFEVRSDHLDHIQRFLMYQRDRLERELQSTLHQGPIYTVRAEAPADRALQIDGYPAGSTFVGRYFSGMSIDLAIADPHQEYFSHWRLGRRRVDDEALHVEIDGDMSIRARFRRSVEEDDR